MVVINCVLFLLQSIFMLYGSAGPQLVDVVVIHLLNAYVRLLE